MTTQEEQDLNRNGMWRRIIKDYDRLTSAQKKSAKKAFCKACSDFYDLGYILHPHQINWCDVYDYEEAFGKFEYKGYGVNMIVGRAAHTLPNCILTQEEYGNWTWGFKENTKKENTMTYNTIVDHEATQRKYLKDRLHQIEYARDNELIAKFNINPYYEPKTKEDIESALKKGDYTIDEAYFTQKGELDCFTSAYRTIKWKNPKEDKAGYEAAKKLFDGALQKTKDSIVLDDIQTAKKSLQDFEAQTF